MQPAPLRSPAPRAFKRRSARVQLKIPLTIAFDDKDTVDAETVTVSQYGARIRLSSERRLLVLGECLQVALHRGQEPRTAKVVWLDKRVSAHYGIELNGPVNFWGVHFPTKDGVWHFERKEARRAVAIDPARADSGPLPVTHPTTKVAPSALATDATVNAKGTASAHTVIARPPVCVTGISSAHQPFAEYLEMAFTSPQEGTVLLQHVVDVGAKLRVTRGDDNRVTTARVLGIGRRREADKWRVRLKCETTLA